MGRKVNVSEVIGKSKLNGFMYGVIAIGVIMILFDGYDMGVWAGTLTSLRTDTGIEDVTLGFITSAGQFGSMLGGIFFGMLSDRKKDFSSSCYGHLFRIYRSHRYRLLARGADRV